MNKELKVAIIGCGSSARQQARGFARSPGSRLVAVCGRGRERAESLARDCGVKAYFSAEEMLEKERPAVVSVTTGEYDHERPVLLALAAGCHVLCEKMLAHTLTSAETMVAAARRADRFLGVNYNYRTVPAHILIKEELDCGHFGTPALFALNAHAYLYPHLLDLVRYFFGEPAQVQGTIVDEPALRPVLSRASGRPWDFSGEILYHPSVAVVASLQYRSPDFVATLASTALFDMTNHWWSFSLFGRGGMITVDHAFKESLGGIASGGPLAARLNALPPCSYADTFDHSIMGFVRAIRENRAPPVTGEDGLAVMQLDAAIVRSAQTASAVALPFHP
jgi:predicted dehydrogenase